MSASLTICNVQPDVQEVIKKFRFAKIEHTRAIICSFYFYRSSLFRFFFSQNRQGDAFCDSRRGLGGVRHDGRCRRTASTHAAIRSRQLSPRARRWACQFPTGARISLTTRGALLFDLCKLVYCRRRPNCVCCTREV